MDDLRPDGLPPLYRLALAYSPAHLRSVYLCLMALDQKLAQIISQASEPLLAQMRLAWWRDQLAKPAEQRPNGEPLLVAIGDAWAGEEPALRALVDGWEELLTDPPLPDSAAENFAEGRAAAFAAIARLAGVDDGQGAVSLAARRWALADLAAKTSASDERAGVVAIGLALGSDPVRLPRAMRPLLVLDGLARTSLAAGGAPLMQGRRNLLSTMRLGLFGR
ncbi:squalene/phytoene synthase family protein [Allopontixanthobacter sp.]|uniref:squalene/phytoene synthase family protein n=1 Tax=Allopontixanthobacter sp. TaxID=2906452 RepID=UPI002ABC7705|nr:squalene/phytoene synthase family protein [Allopontixanthobacter sp.]MDZ4306459.1 squalene/phytoene synthase family protein [Allopontixanthobacter sp.]